MNDIEVWKACPEFPWVEGSSLGRVRTIDRYVNSRNGERSVKGQILKQRPDRYGYMKVQFSMNGKTMTKKVHRIIASCFLLNPNNYQEINHRDNNPLNNNVSNLEWCTHEYNIEYREKYGKALSHPVYAVNLKTLEALWFKSQMEASRELGINQAHIGKVVKGERRTAKGYWFTENKNEITKDKLRGIKDKDNIRFKKSVFAINLTTLEVLRFESQSEAGSQLGVSGGSVSDVLKGRLKQVRGYWFVNTANNAVDVTRVKFGDSVARKVEELMADK